MKRHWSDATTPNQDNKRIKLCSNEMETSTETSLENKNDDDDNSNNNKNKNSKIHSKCLTYDDKVILAPMVRIGTFPMRLMALKYGADIVYNQELIDHKVIRFIRFRNNKYSSIDFIDSTNNKLIFRTFDDERVVFQIGSCDSVRCLKACNIISSDVFGIDLNMGCPKKFSILGGMGAALLNKPEIVEDIIKTLKRNLRNNLSITCKIRILENDKLTLELCRRLEKLNINALGIHARYINDRPRKIARIKSIKPITDCLNIPCIYNGDIYKYSDIKMAKQITGCKSVMIARGAQWNVSIFNKKNKLQSIDKIINQYINISEKYQNIFANSKYVIVKMICGRRWLCKSNVTTTFQKVKNWKDCYQANKVLTHALNERSQNQQTENDTFYTDPSVFTAL